MPTAPLPENPSLVDLEGQARLVRDLVRSGDPGALGMIDELHPRLASADLGQVQRASFKTTDAQLIIARMYGFASWTRLGEHLQVVDTFSFTPHSERPEPSSDGDWFVTLACLDYAENGQSPADRIVEAHRMLAADPTLATGSIAALAAVGDHQVLADELDRVPGGVNGPCGPNGWPPLLFATYSRIDTGNPAWSAVDTVQLLLARGADPNAGFLWQGLVPPFTALTGALGGGDGHQPWHAERLTIGRLLLDAGADPNDGQALYNNGIGGQNHDDPSHLQLLVEYGLGTAGNGPWYQRLGGQLRDPSDLLHDEFEAAALRGRPAICRYLLSLGLDPNRPVGRSQQAPVRLAASRGHHDVLDILADAGVDTSFIPIELAIDHTRQGRAGTLRQLLNDSPLLLDTLRREHPGLVKNLAADHTDTLRLLLELGFDINSRNGGTKTALHRAAQADDVELAKLLIDHGADPNIVDTHIGATPWGWANHVGNDDVARHLHPLTRHGDPPREIAIHHNNMTRILATPELIDRALDEIHRDLAEPTLVGLEAEGANLTIGLGHPELSVALYLDPAGRSWHAKGDPSLADHRALRFAQDNIQRELSPNVAVTVAQARAIARGFLATPAIQLPDSGWVPEGAS